MDPKSEYSTNSSTLTEQLTELANTSKQLENETIAYRGSFPKNLQLGLFSFSNASDKEHKKQLLSSFYEYLNRIDPIYLSMERCISKISRHLLELEPSLLNQEAVLCAEILERYTQFSTQLQEFVDGCQAKLLDRSIPPSPSALFTSLQIFQHQTSDWLQFLSSFSTKELRVTHK